MQQRSSEEQTGMRRKPCADASLQCKSSPQHTLGDAESQVDRTKGQTMKTNTVAGLAIGLLLLTGATPIPPRPPPPAVATIKDLMREKLDLSKQLLEAVTLEDYDTLFTKTVRLTYVSQETSWQSMENPDFARSSLDFRRKVSELNQAAVNKNIDAATLGFVKLTLSCVECHKFIRGTKAG